MILAPPVKETLDPQALAQLATLQRSGRPDFMDRVITLFLQTASDLIKDLEAASTNDESRALYRASHTLKPCSATVGALHLAALCEALESKARSGSVVDQTARVQAIVDEYKRVEAALRGRMCLAD